MNMVEVKVENEMIEQGCTSARLIGCGERPREFIEPIE